ncbi:hypothetical protein GR268_38860 [Rhizobium leguminosarum]|nr:hypothetical protein [Rhizobium leguminosarum]
MIGARSGIAPAAEGTYSRAGFAEDDSDLARERRNVLRQASSEFRRLARISKARVVRFEIILRTATIVML